MHNAAKKYRSEIIPAKYKTTTRAFIHSLLYDDAVLISILT